MAYIVKGYSTGYTDERRHYVDEFPIVDGGNNAILLGEIHKKVDEPSSFTFDIAPNHAHYSDIVNHTTYTEVIFKHKDGTETCLFYGRVISWEVGIDRIKHVTCEGCMAFFDDDVLPYQETVAAANTSAQWEQFVATHFFGVMSNYHAKIDIGFSFYGPTVFKKYTNKVGQSVLSILRDAFVEGNAIIPSQTYPYHIVENGRQVIVTALNTVAGQSQPVIFGENLIDYTERQDAIDEFSELFVTGEDSLGRTIGVSVKNNAWFQSANPESYIRKYATAEGNDWTEATLTQYASQLVEKAKVSVTECDVTAFDMGILDNGREFFDMSKGVPTILHAGDSSRILMIKEITYNLNDPTGDAVTLGNGAQDMTKQITSEVTETEKKIEWAAQQNSYDRIYLKDGIYHYNDVDYPMFQRLDYGTRLQANTNLDDVRKAGVYNIASNTDLMTMGGIERILSFMTPGASRLDVFHTSTSYDVTTGIVQRLTSQWGNGTFERFLAAGSTSWGNWVCVQPKKVYRAVSLTSAWSNIWADVVNTPTNGDMIEVAFAVGGYGAIKCSFYFQSTWQTATIYTHAAPLEMRMNGRTLQARTTGATFNNFNGSIVLTPVM